MVCALSKSTTKGLSISALVTSAISLLLGILAVAARKKGRTAPKSLVGFLAVFYLATFALILAAGFAVYGRSVAKCQDKKWNQQGNSLLKNSGHHHDKNEKSTGEVICVIVALALFFGLAITICSRSGTDCLIFGLFVSAIR